QTIRPSRSASPATGSLQKAHVLACQSSPAGRPPGTRASKTSLCPLSKPVCGTRKRKLEKWEQRLAPCSQRNSAETSRIADQRLRRTCLTCGNVAGFATRGNNTAETALGQVGFEPAYADSENTL